MKTFTEKRFFKWVEDDVSVTLRNCGASYGGGSEVLIVLESNQNHATAKETEVCTTLPASMGLGGGYVPMIVVENPICFRDDITIKIDEGNLGFTLGARDFKGVQCVSYERSEHRERAIASVEHDWDHESS